MSRERDRLKEMWATGGLAAASMEEMMIRNAAAQGYCNALDDILNIDTDTLRNADEL